MPKDNQSDPRNSFVTRYLPWLLGCVMFVVYSVTLNHWVSLQNIDPVAAVSGWMWQPQVINPLAYLVTLPFRLLPVASIPLALNLFSAFCAAATLAVLARSVAILPHDRTEMQRTRERSDFSFLTGWVAWLPPVAAVIFAGFQFGFWENATSFTNESLDLLWFAVILWQLLEYRLDEREGRLFLVSCMFGAGIAENWAMIGFVPIFLMMIIWLRGLSFFNLQFIGRMTWCGLGGLLLIFLLPLIAKISTSYPGAFWQTLKINLRVDWMFFKLPFSRSDARYDIALMSLTSLLPAFAMAIRWSASFGDSSRVGATLVHYFMHVVNAILLGVLVWVTLDPPFSPHHLLLSMGISAPGLTLNYIAALCIGYYLGYFALVFGKAPIPTRRNTRPDPALPRALAWLCPVVLVAAVISTLIGAGLLVYKTLPEVRSVNDDSFLKFAKYSTQKLPSDGAILFCDSDDPGQDQPIRAYLIQAVLAHDGLAQKYPVVDTAALNWASYHEYLHKRYPKDWPQTVSTNDVGSLSLLRIYLTLGQLAKSNNLCYLNPSFGYYFEQFYLEPHGLFYNLKTVSQTNFLPPELDKNIIDENESFWTQAVPDVRPAIDSAQNPPNPAKQPGVIGWFLMHLHVTPESNPNALMAGTFYSRGLDYLGVQVQRAGELEKAANLFTSAQNLNSNNVVAGINLAFNKTLRLGSPTTVDLSRVNSDEFGKYRTWIEALDANGPFDESSFCFEHGVWMMQSSPPLLRQAAVSFDRVRQLVPDNLAARLFLASIYLTFHQADKALEVLHEPMIHPLRFALTEYNSVDRDLLTATAYFQKNENVKGAALLESEMDLHPDNETLLLVSAQVFNRVGLYTNSLRAINRKLARSPNDPVWLYGKGMVCLQTGDYDDAVAAFDKFLAIQTNNPAAVFNRAVANFKGDHLDRAETDFRQLQVDHTNSFQVAYGLGEIAWRRHQTNEAIRNYQIYLANAPTNAAELKIVHERMSQIDGK